MTEPEKIEPAKAGNAFLQGFAGCLGVGVAIALILIFLLVVVVACNAATSSHY